MRISYTNTDRYFNDYWKWGVAERTEYCRYMYHILVYFILKYLPMDKKEAFYHLLIQPSRIHFIPRQCDTCMWLYSPEWTLNDRFLYLIMDVIINPCWDLSHSMLVKGVPEKKATLCTVHQNIAPRSSYGFNRLLIYVLRVSAAKPTPGLSIIVFIGTGCTQTAQQSARSTKHGIWCNYNKAKQNKLSKQNKTKQAKQNIAAAQA